MPFCAFSVLVSLFSFFLSFGTVGLKNLYDSRLTLKLGIRGLRDVATAIISEKQVQKKRVRRIQSSDYVCPKDPFIRLSFYSK